MTLTTEQITALAQQYGFTSGASAGYSDPGLWLKDADGGGHTSVYPTQRGLRWVVAFFGPRSNVPIASRSFSTPDEAFRYAAS
jgi:hypothetical protein